MWTKTFWDKFFQIKKISWESQWSNILMSLTMMSSQSRIYILNSNRMKNSCDSLLTSTQMVKDRQESTFSISWTPFILTISIKSWKTQIRKEWLLKEKRWKLRPSKLQTSGMNNLKSCPTLQVSSFHMINNYYNI